MRNEQDFTIQKVLAPDFGRPAVLYLRDGFGAPGLAGATPWHLNAGDLISTDTYFNSFYLDVWSRFAALGRIGLRVEATGRPVNVAIHSVGTTGAQQFIDRQTISGKHVIWLPDLPKGTARVFLRLVALGKCMITCLEWVTDIAPVCTPELSVGLCTYNRETHLAATLSALVSQRATTPALRHIYVVNQGRAFADTSLLALCEAPGVKLITQPNLGGCGGFTRGMMESLGAASPTTHHVMLDDDIVLDPRMLERVVHFLAYVPSMLALGGQMLEIERPVRLHEAGARLHALGNLESIGQGRAMDKREALQIFAKTPQIDYNAWWFCVVPLAAIREVGLPPPLFIRGDDIEYGLRLSNHGIPTIPLPGCAVWHESFRHKTDDWLIYYYLRNLLLVSVLHRGRFVHPDALYLLGLLMSIVLQHRYRATEIAIHAIEDVLSDPAEALGPDSASRHARLSAWIATLPAPQKVEQDTLGQTKEGMFVPLDPSVPAMVWMCVSAFIRLHLARLLPRRALLRFPNQPQAPAIGARDYVVATDSDQKSFLLHSSNLWRLWRLTFKSLHVCLRYLRQSRKLEARHRASLERLQSAQMWDAQFASGSATRPEGIPVPRTPPQPAAEERSATPLGIHQSGLR